MYVCCIIQYFYGLVNDSENFMDYIRSTFFDKKRTGIPLFFHPDMLFPYHIQQAFRYIRHIDRYPFTAF